MSASSSTFPSRVGVFGGSFDPPHVGHLLLAERIRDQYDLDVVIWIPGNIPPHKQDHNLSSAADRLEMVRLAVDGNPYFAVSDLEIKRSGVSFTVDTLETLRKQYPDSELFLIIGGDSYANFGSWYRPERITDLASLIVYGRRHHSPEEEPAYKASFADGPLIDISSTEARRLVTAGMSAKYLLADRVLEYIEQKGLYVESP